MPLPTVILPGFFAAGSEYRPLENALNQLGIPTITVPLTQRDWWPTLGGRSIVPILRALDRTVQETLEKYQTSQINLIGHSAGGWISRIYLGEKPYTQIPRDVTGEYQGLWHKHPYVNTLISLGTPHVSQERWTRKNLDFVANTYPGAFYPNVRYICLAGKAIYGKQTWKTWLAYESYKLTIGEGETWGDGITPIKAAHLEGAENLILDDVWHSPRSPGKWYGSPEVLSAWVNYLQ